MIIEDVKKIISKNNVRSDLIKINDKYLIEGVYYLYYDETLLKWAVFLFDRDYKDKYYYISEDEACRKFLKLIFSNPMIFRDFTIKKYWEIKKRGENLIEKYLENNTKD